MRKTLQQMASEVDSMPPGMSKEFRVDLFGAPFLANVWWVEDEPDKLKAELFAGTERNPETRLGSRRRNISAGGHHGNRTDKVAVSLGFLIISVLYNNGLDDSSVSLNNRIYVAEYREGDDESPD